MDETVRREAKLEIEKSLMVVLFSMRRLGIAFVKPRTTAAYFRQKIILVLSIFGICFHVFSELIYIVFMFASSPRIEDVVPLFHTFGYGVLSVAKIFAFWYKKSVFGELIDELAGIWPMPPLDEQALSFKEKSLSALRISHRWYFAVNVMGVWFYNLTPIITYFYRVWQGQEARIGYVWASWYPFDKHQPIAHIGVYLFEMYAGVTCVWIMVSSDLLFSGMASHIALLLRILQWRLESLASIKRTDEENYEEIRSNIKLHQRLISYCNSLEEAFSVVNLINIVMSSINICCVMFVIVLLEPVMAISNKLFLASILIQVGAMCWYADDILHANENLSAAVYSSGWYKTSPRCRRSLLFLILRTHVSCITSTICVWHTQYIAEVIQGFAIITRLAVGLVIVLTLAPHIAASRWSQKPLAFTAMKFTKISLKTYSSILTRSYSYFALLYTMYNDK